MLVALCALRFPHGQGKNEKGAPRGAPDSFLSCPAYRRILALASALEAFSISAQMSFTLLTPAGLDVTPALTPAGLLGPPKL